MKRTLIGLLIALLLSLTAHSLTNARSASVPLGHGYVAGGSFVELSSGKEPKLDVPFVPTPEEVVETMLRVAGVNKDDVLYDLGCGDGRIVVTAAGKYGVRATGVDLDPQRISESNDNARKARVADRVRFMQRDLFTMDISDATVMTLYLLPSVNLKLRPKFLTELRPGTRIVSHDFDMGDWKADQTIEVSGHTVYYWVIPANVSGTWNGKSGKGKDNHTLRLTQQFQKVSGTLTVRGKEMPLKGVSLTGGALEFTADGGIDGIKAPVRFKGRVEGNTIRGSIKADTGKGNTLGWSARRDKSTIVPLDRSDAGPGNDSTPDKQRKDAI